MFYNSSHLYVIKGYTIKTKHLLVSIEYYWFLALLGLGLLLKFDPFSMPKITNVLGIAHVYMKEDI